MPVPSLMPTIQIEQRRHRICALQAHGLRQTAQYKIASSAKMRTRRVHSIAKTSEVLRSAVQTTRQE
jgi:hypothetical protein